MRVLEIETGRVGYRDLLDLVLRHGDEERSAPRGLPTLDAGPVTTVLLTPHDSLPVGVGRRISSRVAAAEAVQLIGAWSDPRLLPPQFDRFKEDGGGFHGAYGLRVGSQLATVVHRLTHDVHSRRAAVTLWDPALDGDDTKRDLPCTVALFFRFVDGRLHMRVVMRSQDVWLGTPYDWFQFAQVQLSVARALGAGVGPYHHVTMSTHLYESDLERVEEVQSGAYYDTAVNTPNGIGRPADSWMTIRRRARELPYVNTQLQAMTVDELWYRQHLADELKLERKIT